ncbi:hypothetical protein F4553_007806 [Allocatelliglobosispora scoriae]|uniref:DUF3558 domain-containing protein n=1 Tax=Allocatelliglobosispora scoriae TaxID=643052 RepID=A0A841C5M3_9ACTN|nr:DUF3558 family protein [Allocatelliglobosispora scoriae]MBB5874372.1 hypothetical protein [Allocatelliglobosispora scoriae]
MRVRYAIAATALLATAALGACGTESSTQPNPPAGAASAAAPGKQADLDPCAMVTPAEVAAALTQPAGESRTKNGAGTKQCEWDSKSGDRYLVLQVLVVLPAPADTKDGYGWTKAKFDEYWSPGAQPLAGLGDAAYHLKEKGAGTLFVLDGSLAFSVATVFYRDADAPAADVIVSTLKPLATAVAARY